ncbi:MAG TPA: S-methyl-5-thioribose-1-phosphate isomerase [Xanthomonadales bacterium]|nr:S-methyl-5-thioribose-1-phosphate isomerase [Xanthomonadales bacterium]
MKINGVPYRSIWLNSDGWSVDIIDQTRLPHEFEVRNLTTVSQAAEAISVMRVRGAPLIGATAAYGMALAINDDDSEATLEAAHAELLATRPTGSNLKWALDRMLISLRPVRPTDRVELAYRLAAEICDQDVAICEAIGDHGLNLIQEAWSKRDESKTSFNILTHCNAGWIATVDWGTALAPIYKAHDAGIPVHVWVDETRPRNQGAALTAWELAAHGVPHDVIVDNAGGHLMQHGQVDMVITGTDRTTRCGDVCNKIGTYLKALAANDNDVPFYVGLPGPTIDWTICDGLSGVPIEERDGTEVTHLTGRNLAGDVVTVQLTPDGVTARNPAFDVTPSRLVTGLITERGVCEASEAGLLSLYPEMAGEKAQ